MMKAQLDEGPDAVTLRVCGRLAEGWVAELESCWNAARTSHPSVPIAVDLRSVTFIDHSGEELLRRMHTSGAQLLTSGLWNQEVVNHVTGGSK